MPSGLGAFYIIFVCYFFPVAIKPKKHVEVFIAPLNAGAGGSHNVHGTYSTTHALGTRRLARKKQLCCAKQIYLVKQFVKGCM